MRAKPLSPHIWFASRKGRRGAPRWSRVGLERLPGACPGQARVRRARGGVRPGGVVSDGSRGVAPTPGSASSNDEGKPRHKRAAGGCAVLTARQRRDSRRSGLFGVRAPRRMLSPRRTDPRTQHAETLSRGNSWAEPRKMTRVAQALARAGARAAPLAPQAAGVRLQQHVMCTANQLRTCRRQRQGRCRKCPFRNQNGRHRLRKVSRPRAKCTQARAKLSDAAGISAAHAYACELHCETHCAKKHRDERPMYILPNR